MGGLVAGVGGGGCLPSMIPESQPASQPPRLFVALGCGGVSRCHRLQINTCFVFSAVLNSERAAGLRPKKKKKNTKNEQTQNTVSKLIFCTVPCLVFTSVSGF